MSADGDTVRVGLDRPIAMFDQSQYEDALAALSRLEARVDALTAALEVYADARNWGIQRDQKLYAVCAWIGPGATDATPNGPGVARAALAEAAPEATP